MMRLRSSEKILPTHDKDLCLNLFNYDYFVILILFSRLNPVTFFSGHALTGTGVLGGCSMEYAWVNI